MKNKSINLNKSGTFALMLRVSDEQPSSVRIACNKHNITENKSASGFDYSQQFRFFISARLRSAFFCAIKRKMTDN